MDSFTLGEILSQPLVWRSTLQVMEQNAEQVRSFWQILLKESDIVLTGCGSSYYLPLVAASFYTKITGRRACGVPASDIMLCPETVFARDVPLLLIPISRKGETEETNAAARYAKKKLGAAVLGISCTAETTLSQLCDFTLVSAEAAEKSKFMTRSFTSMLLMFQYATALVSSNDAFLEELSQLPDLCQHCIDTFQSTAEQLAAEQNANLFIYLGQGSYYGLAAECMLKVKEMACTPAEAYHSLELMHGPKYAVDDKTLVTVLLSDTAARYEIPLLSKIKALGAQLAVICERSTPEMGDSADSVIELRSGLSEHARLLLYMPIVQLFGYFRAVRTGKVLE
jgi:glucosamine--fructose-6-phosphate aminotransferase (isomerizing)